MTIVTYSSIIIYFTILLAQALCWFCQLSRCWHCVTLCNKKIVEYYNYNFAVSNAAVDILYNFAIYNVIKSQCLSQFTYFFKILAATCVPGEIIDWSDQCLSEIVDQRPGLSCKLVRHVYETSNTTMAWNVIKTFLTQLPSRSALTYLVSKDVDCWLQVHVQSTIRRYMCTSDRQ